MKITRVALLLLVTFLPSVFGQRLVSSASNGSMPVDKTSARIAKAFGNYAVDLASNSIDLYKIIYTSRDENGKAANLTGLVAWPRDGAPKGLVVFCHGTIADRKSSPSFWKGEENGNEAETAVLAFATGGYAVVMPDYIGLGDHKAGHPYPLSVTNARSGIDIIAPARALAKQKGYSIGLKLFVTGYSEGGGIAMALTRELQNKPGADYRVESSAPASGPYDLSGVTRQFMLKQPTNQIGFGVRLYFLSYSTYSMRKNHNVKITDYFKPAMANSIWLNYNANLKDEDLIKRLGLTAVLMRAKNSILNVMTPRFEHAIRTLDQRDPLVAELFKNNSFDWTPRTRMLLINLEGDAVVDPANTDKALNTMRRHGVGPDALRRYVIRDGSLNHLTAVPAAMAAARRFFDNGFSGVREAQ